jgi:hypothetical protein
MSRFPAYDPTRVPFKRSDGLTRPQLRYAEPGKWWKSTRGGEELVSACFPAVTTVIEHLLTGSDPSTGTWTLTVAPVLTQTGAAGPDGLAAASISFVAAADTLADIVLGLIDAAETGATLTDASDLANWVRFNSYVALTGDGAETLTFTARASGTTFTVTVTAPAGNGSTETVVSSPDTTVISVGCYVALDTDQGTDGYNDQGQAYIKPVESDTPADEILGPVYLGDGTEPLEPGDLYREYNQGSDVALASFGKILAYADKAIPASSIGSAVYVRHTTVGNFRAGTASDADGAEDAATADVWTGTPTAVNDTEYIFEIDWNSNIVQITVLADGGTSATEICNSARTEIAKYTGAGEALFGLTASGTATLILTGPADGRGFTPSQSQASAGTIAWVHTTTGVTTHTLLTRGDRWLASSPAVGSAPVDVPYANA